MMYQKAYDQVFGQVNTKSPVKDGKSVCRVGKTAKDKANGHIPYKKNRREWDDGGRQGAGKWVKM